MSADELHGLDEAGLQRLYAQTLADLPLRAPIFLPTDRMSLMDRVRGVLAVRDLCRNRLEAEYKPRMRALKAGIANRDRCFIIGNGPSLNKTDLTLLKGETTFAVNGFFLKARDLDWKPTFYVVEDHLVAEDRAQEIEGVTGSTRLFPAYLRYCLSERADTVFFDHRPRTRYPHGFNFSTDAAHCTYAGCTVTFTCMQLAAYMGFREIYLIGVDASYKIPDDANQGGKYGVGILDMASDDPNHFHPDYFGKGYRWHDPQVDKMIEAYEEARRTLEGTGSTIYNATLGGNLEVFERREYASLFAGAGQ